MLEKHKNEQPLKSAKTITRDFPGEKNSSGDPLHQKMVTSVQKRSTSEHAPQRAPPQNSENADVEKKTH